MEHSSARSAEPKKVAILADLSLQGARMFLLNMANWAREHANWTTTP